MQNYNLIKQSLHNLSERENNNRYMTDDKRSYYRGMIVMAVSAIMDSGKTFMQAGKIVNDLLPQDHINPDDFSPKEWIEFFK